MERCGGKDCRVKIRKWRKPPVSRPSRKSVAWDVTGLLHTDLLSALDFPTASGASSTSFKHTQGKALQHCWTFLWQVSCASFFELMVAEKITQGIQDVDMLLASPSTSKSLRVLWILFSRTNILDISIKDAHAVILNGGRKQVPDFQVRSNLSFSN